MQAVPKIGFTGFGAHLPDTVLTNDDLAQMVETSDDWIRRRTGIRTRRILDADETLLGMAEKAARRALNDAGVAPEDLAEIRVGVNTWLRFPSLASQLQNLLGAEQASASDVSAGCSGFIFAVEDAYNKLLVEKVRYDRDLIALVVGVDALSHVTNWTDRSTCVLLGDGAGAVVLKKVECGEILATHTHAQGRFGDMLYLDPVVANQTVRGEKRLTHADEFPRAYLHMDGRKVFGVACQTMVRDIRKVIEKYNRISKAPIGLDDIDYIYPHQANLRIIEMVVKKLGVERKKVYTEGVVKFGNTSAASIPIGYCDTRHKYNGDGRGRLEIDVAFGAGFASGAILRRVG
jgi:3-oxoacyl-[acyl-carrier-protein] synthase-3